MNKSIIIFSLVFLFHGAINLLQAQTTLQVVTKNIDKTLEYKKGYSLQISGEKAAIVIDTWDLDKIQVNIQLSAKHPELETAEQDLEYFKYVSERIGKTIYLRNFIAIPKGKNKPSSKYKASFKVMVPQECKVELSNDFGNAQINNLKGQLTVKSNFCKTELHNLTGEISIHSKFGDIKGDQLSGLVDIHSTRSDITLSQMEGTYKITSKYGVIRINADEELLNLNIDAEKTDIHF